MADAPACDTPGRMNLEYVWWIVALVLAGVGVLAFLGFGRVPEIEDEDQIEDEDGTADEAAEAPPATTDLDAFGSGPAG
jgi:hypothetical protein